MEYFNCKAPWKFAYENFIGAQLFSPASLCKFTIPLLIVITGLC